MIDGHTKKTAAALVIYDARYTVFSYRTRVNPDAIVGHNCKSKGHKTPQFGPKPPPRSRA